MIAQIPKQELEVFLKLCQKLETFVAYVLKATPTAQQLEVIKAIDNGARYVAVKSGHGCFGIDTEIMMSDGTIKKVQDIKIGDKLMGDDGAIRNVLSLARGQEEMFKFTYNNGDYHIFNKSHILVLFNFFTNDDMEISVNNYIENKSKYFGKWYCKRKLNFKSRKFKRLFITKIESLGVGNYYGFTLDGNHRFLGGDFTILRNTGKSCLLSWIAIWQCVSKVDVKVPITSPSAPQLNLTLFPEIKKWLAKLPSLFVDSYRLKADEIHFENGNFIALRTARKEEPEALQGFHAENLLYLIDEGSGVDNKIFEVIEGALTSSKNMLIMVGNPTRTSGKFYDAFNKDREIWTTFTLNAELSENVSKATIQRARKQYGLDSDAYRVRVLGEFPKASSDALFSVEILDEAVERGGVADYKGSEIWGLDIAEFGDDYSVLCKRNGFFIRGFEKYSNLDAQPLADTVAREYSQARIKPLAIYIDTIGVGAGVWSILSNYGLPVYRGDVRKKSYQKGMFNKRIEIYIRLKDRLPQLRLPDDDELYGELGALRYEFAESSGDMKLESKRDTKKTLGRSPDKSDSLALTFYDEFDIANAPIREIDYRTDTQHTMTGGLAW